MPYRLTEGRPLWAVAVAATTATEAVATISVAYPALRPLAAIGLPLCAVCAVRAFFRAIPENRRRRPED
jgi:hypothetical protein